MKPSEPKNQVSRSRDEPDPAASSFKPELGEHRHGGLRGKDMQQADLRDTNRGTYSTPDTILPDVSQRTPHQDAQHGADVRGDPAPMSKVSVPEGLKRERQHPLSPSHGRSKEVPKRVPQNTWHSLRGD